VAGQKRMAARESFAAALAMFGEISAAEAEKTVKRVKELEIIGSGINPLPLVGGGDLIAAGYKPGPNFKRMLEMVYDAQLEGRVCDLAGAMELVRQQRI